METLGNFNLLNQHKIGYLAGREVSSLAVLPTYDWAVEIAKREDIAIVSGFHSKMERQVLDFLLQGRCSIICVMARGIYKKPTAPFLKAFADNRVLFISNEKSSLTRANRETCQRRNKYVAQISEELVFSSVRPTSSLYQLSQIQKPITKY